MLKFVANIPKRVTLANIVTRFGETKKQAFERVTAWKSQFITGKPKADTRHTAAELAALGYVGLYEERNWYDFYSR